jgi:hypothetical protein
VRNPAVLSGALGLAVQLFVPWAPVLEARLRLGDRAATKAAGRPLAGLAQIKTGAGGIGDTA